METSVISTNLKRKKIMKIMDLEISGPLRMTRKKKRKNKEMILVNLARLKMRKVNRINQKHRFNLSKKRSINRMRDSETLGLLINLHKI